MNTAPELKAESEVIELAEAMDGMQWAWIGCPDPDAMLAIVDLVLRQPQPTLPKAA